MCDSSLTEQHFRNAVTTMLQAIDKAFVRPLATLVLDFALPVWTWAAITEGMFKPKWKWASRFPPINKKSLVWFEWKHHVSSTPLSTDDCLLVSLKTKDFQWCNSHNAHGIKIGVTDGITTSNGVLIRSTFSDGLVFTCVARDESSPKETVSNRGTCKGNLSQVSRIVMWRSIDKMHLRIAYCPTLSERNISFRIKKPNAVLYPHITLWHGQGYDLVEWDITLANHLVLA